MASTDALARLTSHSELYLRQQQELAELLGFETRNKYAVFTPEREQVAFAAEQQKGFFGFLARYFLGHWRTFEIHFFDAARQPLFRAVHPFRFVFQRLDLFAADGRYLGALQQRFGLFSKRFDVLGPEGQLLLEVRSGLFRPWSFPFTRNGEQQAVIEKRWSGGLVELFTDRDNFRIRFLRPDLGQQERTLVLAAAIFVDLSYFERHAD